MAVQSVQRAIDILREVALRAEGFGVRELAGRLDLRPSTTQNLINTLSQNGLLNNDGDDRRYCLSSAAWVLIQGVDVAESIRRVVDNFMREMTQSYGVNSEMVCWSDGAYYRIGLWQGDGGFRHLPSGHEEQRRIHHSAVGQALLAWSSETRVAEYMELADYDVSGNIPRNASELRACLERVRLAGYASADTTASAKYLQGLAMPILAPNGSVLTALNFHKPISKATEDEDTMRDELQESVVKLSEIIVGVNGRVE